MDAKLDRKTALKDVLPTAFGYVGIGLAFGIVGKASGLSVLELGLMSLIAYGGSAQFIMVSMMLAHSPVLSIVLAAFLVNARMILIIKRAQTSDFNQESSPLNYLIYFYHNSL